MGNLLKLLQEEADFVIFDTPPVMAVTDATVLASRTDGCLLVVDAGRTRRAVAKRSKDALASVGAYLPGVALNRLSARANGYYNYYHYYSAESHDLPRPTVANWLSHRLNRNGNGHRNGNGTHSSNGHKPVAAPVSDSETDTRTKT
jgi:Mrp family chromosome partitioning ATPase